MLPIFVLKINGGENEEEFKGTIPAPYNENLVRDILDQAKCICGAEIHEGTQAYDNIHKLLYQVLKLQNVFRGVPL